MTRVTISARFQIVIPKAVRGALQLRPGQHLTVQLDGSGRMLLEPQSPMHELDIRSARGFLAPIAGVDVTDVPDDEERPSDSLFRSGRHDHGWCSKSDLPSAVDPKQPS